MYCYGWRLTRDTIVGSPTRKSIGNARKWRLIGNWRYYVRGPCRYKLMDHLHTTHSKCMLPTNDRHFGQSFCSNCGLLKPALHQILRLNLRVHIYISYNLLKRVYILIKRCKTYLFLELAVTVVLFRWLWDYWSRVYVRTGRQQYCGRAIFTYVPPYNRIVFSKAFTFL